MFYKIKTKFNFFTTKKKCILFILIILLISIIIVFHFVSKNKTINQTFEVNKKEDISKEKVVDVIYGSDIKNKYKEFQGTEFAILVTTKELLSESDKVESKEYFRYVIDNDDSNMISKLKIGDKIYHNAVFINYNRLLKDTVVTKDISGGYIAPYGFTGKDEIEYNQYIEGSSIAISDNNKFSEYPIYDGNYKIIGILYIESE